SRMDVATLAPKPRPELPRNHAQVKKLPGFTGARLSLPTSNKPPAMTFLACKASPRRQSGDASKPGAARDQQNSNPQANAWGSPGAAGSPVAFTSLKGHVYLATDTDGDHIEDTLTTVEEGLAAPFGILADGNSLLVAHKP